MGAGVFVVFCEFLSTPSARRATPDIGGGIQDFTISIHALREEGDEKNGG